jgi:DNA-binding beta-propeller fold protein YncE
MDRRDFLAGAAALALAPRELLAAAPPRRIALATADLEAHVVAVDLATGAVVERIHTHAYPRSIETVGACAVVCHSELGIVSVLDARSLHVVHVLRGFDEPRYTAAHPDGRHAYVTDAERGEVVLLDVLAGRVLARERVGHLARHIAIDRAARHLWIALGSKAREITLVALDGTRPHAKHTFSPPSRGHDVGFAPDGRHAWISSGEGRELAVYDLPTRRVVARPPAGLPPQHVTFSNDRAFVTSGWSGSLQVHTLGGRALASVPVPVGSYNVQHADGIVVTPALGHGQLTTLTLGGHVIRSEKVARSSHDACVAEAAARAPAADTPGSRPGTSRASAVPPAAA